MNSKLIVSVAFNALALSSCCGISLTTEGRGRFFTYFSKIKSASEELVCFCPAQNGAQVQTLGAEKANYVGKLFYIDNPNVEVPSVIQDCRSSTSALLPKPHDAFITEFSSAIKTNLKWKTPISNDDALSTAKIIHLAASMHFVKDINSKTLGNLLNKAIVAAVIGKAEGNGTLARLLCDLLSALDDFYKVRKQQEKEDKANEQLFAKVTKQGEEILSLLENVKAQEPGTAPDGKWNVLNKKNISAEMNDWIVSVVKTLSIEDNNDTPEPKAPILPLAYFGITTSYLLFLALNSVYQMERTRYQAQQYVFASFLFSLNFVPNSKWQKISNALKLAAYWQYITGGYFSSLKKSSSMFKSLKFTQQDQGVREFFNRQKLDQFQNVQFEYERQLEILCNMAQAQFKNCSSAEAFLSSIDCKKIYGPQKHQELYKAFTNVLKVIVQLRKECEKIIFIVVHGEQGVGKSWFIQEINGIKHGWRDSTDYPTFQRYGPRQSSQSPRYYILDVPGNNSYNENLVHFASLLYGVASIGIKLLPFDTRAPVLPHAALQNVFGNCSSVLVALHKVSSRNPDYKQLPTYIENWRKVLEDDRVIFSNDGQTQYTLMATDMTGTNESDRDGENEMRRKFRQDLAAENLRHLLANGGQSLAGILKWLENACGRAQIA